MPRVESIANGSSRIGGRRARAGRVSTSLAEINVVPLVDVMLVLLVIFMIAAPMMKQGFAVRLPESRQSRAIEAPVTVTVPVTFRRDRRVQIDGEFVPFDVLDERIRQAISAKSQKSVVLAGDGALSYADVITVWDQLNRGGVESISVQTQPAARR
jgi:biopolymer transport protein ExbD